MGHRMPKLLFALAALAATALLIGLAWGVAVLMVSGTLALPKWVPFAAVAAIPVAANLLRWRRRRGRR